MKGDHQPELLEQSPPGVTAVYKSMRRVRYREIRPDSDERQDRKENGGRESRTPSQPVLRCARQRALSNDGQVWRAGSRDCDSHASICPRT